MSAKAYHENFIKNFIKNVTREMVEVVQLRGNLTQDDLEYLLDKVLNKMKLYDEVNGQIIGGEYGLCWVTYEGRKQGATGYPSNEVDAEKFCQKIVDRIKKDCGEHFSVIYPNKNGWVFHFDGV